MALSLVAGSYILEHPKGAHKKHNSWNAQTIWKFFFKVDIFGFWKANVGCMAYQKVVLFFFMFSVGSMPNAYDNL